MNRHRTVRGVLVNHASLHHKYDSPDGGNVFQQIAVERDDVRLKTGRERADLISHAERFRSQRIGGDHCRHGVHSGAYSVDKILSVATVRACHRVGAVNNLQSSSADRSLNKFLVRRNESFHRCKTLFRVIGWSEIFVFVLEIGFKQQPGLRIEIRPAFGH